MVGLQYAYSFHTRVAAGNYKSRIRIYSIDLAQNPIDIRNPNEVEEYADLLKYKNSDTDSNGRIWQNGIKINNYFNKQEQIEIGDAVSCNIEIPLINDDGYFSSYDWEQTIIIYWDVWEELNSMWLTCPLGVYWWERPTKTSDVVVVAKANDAMSAIFENWVPGIAFPDSGDDRWENGIPLYYFYNQIVSGISGVVPDPSIQYVPNMTVLYYKPPFDPSSMSKREVLAWMAGVCGGIAYISRDGTPRIKFFSDAYYREFPQGPKYYYTLDGDAGPTPIVKIDIGEYTVPQIDELIAMVGQSGSTYTAGSGTNALYSINNGFLATYGMSAQLMVNKMYDVVSGTDASSDIVPYNPISLQAYIDPSVEAGDIIRVVRGGVTYAMPIFQQTLYWNGTEWTAEMQNSGTEKRTVPSEADRMSYVWEQRMSGLEPYKGGYDTSDNTPYVMRPSFAGNREDDKLIGGTIAWNQLLDGSADANWSANNATKSFSDGVCTFTASAKDGYVQLNVTRMEKDHVYFAIVDIKVTTATNLVALNWYGSEYKYCEPTTDWQKVSAIRKRSASNNNFKMRISDRRTSGRDAVQVKNFMLFDLTAMFGSTIADYAYMLESGTRGAGVAWLKSYGFFADDNYSYHAATLESVNASAHVMRDAGTHIVGNYALDPTLQLRGILKLDANNNLYYDGDEYASDGTVTRRYGIVDLGTLSWSYNSTVTRFGSGSLASVVARPSGNNVIGNIKCAKYVTDITDHGTDSNYDKIIMVAASGNVFIRDSAYDSAVALKASLSGVYLVYELATPTTETADPYTNPQLVDASGTEQYVDAAYTSGTRDFEMPVGHNTDYYNLQSDAQEIYNTPTTDGSYRLVCNVVNGKASFEWVPV